jgi:hypothetical protein
MDFGGAIFSCPDVKQSWMCFPNPMHFSWWSTIVLVVYPEDGQLDRNKTVLYTEIACQYPHTFFMFAAVEQSRSYLSYNYFH